MQSVARRDERGDPGFEACDCIEGVDEPGAAPACFVSDPFAPMGVKGRVGRKFEAAGKVC